VRNNVVLIVAVALSPTITSAAESPVPADRAGVIAPFIDEQTIAVAHVDTTRVDLDAIESLITTIVRDAEPDATATHPALTCLAEVKQTAQKWIADFVRAGGRDIYLVASLADLPEGNKPFVIVPLSSRADSRAIAALLCSGRADGPTSAPAGESGAAYPDMVCEQVDQAMFAGSRRTLERLRGMKPAPRPELARAFETAGDAAAQVLVLPTADNRRVVEEMMPTLPEQIGGGPVTAITRGLMWATIAVETKPAVSCRIVIQSQDAEAAQALKGVLDKIIDEAGKQMAKLAQPAAPGLDTLLAALRPTVQRDRLMLDLNAQSLTTTIARTLAPPLERARLLARRAASASNLKQLMVGVHMYAADHKDEFPRDLQALVDGKYISSKVLISALQPERKDAYVYIRPSVPLNKIDPQSLIVYEAFDTWGQGTNVAYADGHVEFLGDKAKFDAMLANARQAAAESKPAAPTGAPSGEKDKQREKGKKKAKERVRE